MNAAKASEPVPTGRVLIVEDDPGVRDSLDAILGSEYETRCVGSVAAAVKILADEAFDVVVTDYNLADGTGVTVIETTRVKRPGATIIVLTGHVDYAGVRALQKSGRVLVLFKPINPDELIAWVKNGVTMARLAAATSRLTSRGFGKPTDDAGAARPGSGRLEAPIPREAAPGSDRFEKEGAGGGRPSSGRLGRPEDTPPRSTPR